LIKVSLTPRLDGTVSGRCYLRRSGVQAAKLKNLAEIRRVFDRVAEAVLGTDPGATITRVDTCTGVTEANRAAEANRATEADRVAQKDRATQTGPAADPRPAADVPAAAAATGTRKCVFLRCELRGRPTDAAVCAGCGRPTL
jgi:hypothetical protein